MLVVDVGGDGTADFSFDTASFTAITVAGRDGADTITGSFGLAALGQLTIDGGRGNDSLLGGDGGDVLRGGPGNDTVIGARGNDTGLLGAGDDRFTWNPGDNDDLDPGDPPEDRERAGAVVAVADVGEAQALELAEALAQRQQVGERLARVVQSASAR